MKTLNLIIGLSLGLSLTACPGDDGSEEGGGTAESSSSGTPTTTPMTTTEAEDTTTTSPPGTTTDEPGTTAVEPDTTADDTGSTTDEPGTTTGEPALGFEADVYPIIMANCSCHVNGASGMLPMPDAATAYGNLVDVPSANAVNNQDRVEPGDPDASFLWHKVNGTLEAGEGGQMPLMAAPLGAGDLATIEQWILDGAQP
jgi:hypothetical protein